MPDTCLLALDQGTTSSRAILFNHAGETLGIAQVEFPQHFPKSGWVEHDPFDLWESQAAVITEVLEASGTDPRSIAAIGITNQRETTLVWDRQTGEPVHPAIVWQDRRTAGICDRLKKDGAAKLVRERTGLLIDPYFSGTKLAWILENIEGVRQRAEKGQLCFGTVDTWILWNLTGGAVHLTDVTNASRTLLMNLRTGEWDEDLLDLLKIPRPLLPDICSSSEILGETAAAVLPAGIPIAGMAGDQQAALFGQACFEPGMVKSTYGTGCFLLMHTGFEPVRSQNHLLSTVAWKLGYEPMEYALEGSVFMGGALMQWLRDTLQLIDSAPQCDELALTVPDAGGLFLVPAFAGLGAPHWDPYARGLAIGLTRASSRAHLCRAALEAIAFQCAEVIECMRRDSGLPLKELRVDGGASRSQPLLQFQADLLQCPVIRPRCIETTALGAACLAGLAVGYWENRQDLKAAWNIDQRFYPEAGSAAMQALQADWDRAVQRAKGWQPASDPA